MIASDFLMPDLSLQQVFEGRPANAAVDLIARTTQALRTDSRFVEAGTDSLGGVLLGDEAAADLSVEALDQVLARIEAADTCDARAAAFAARGDSIAAEVAALPSPLREAALDALADDRWRLGGLGIRRLILGASGAAQAELMRIEPGFGAPTHDHTARELTLIVTGAYDDGHAWYGPGDLSIAEPGFAHAPTALKGDICYVLAVTYGPPRFLGLFGGLQKGLGFPWTPAARRTLS
jgi:putative transcriptional regulator